jgi:hypothetical protein
MSQVNECFAHITTDDGEKYQVLRHDAAGEPVDWDEEATDALVRAARPELFVIPPTPDTPEEEEDAPEDGTLDP